MRGILIEGSRLDAMTVAEDPESISDSVEARVKGNLFGDKVL